MIRKVTQRLHGLIPDVIGDRCPSSIAIEFLKIPNKWLDKGFLPSAGIFPNLGLIQNDWTVNNSGRVPAVDDALCPLNNIELLVEIVVCKDRTGLEFLGHTLLPCARTLDISASIDIFLSASGIEAVVDNRACGRVIA